MIRYDIDMPIRRDVTHDFFVLWTDHMAYTLGFFAADGSMLRNRRGAHFIEFHVSDGALLKKIRTLLKSNHKISVRRRNARWRPEYRLQIGSKKMFSDLERLGFTQGKSRTLELPSVPKRYVGSYVRGYFDGDGCVYLRRLRVRSRKNPRWVFQVRFTSGSAKYLRQLLKLLHQFHVKGGSIQKKERGYELVLSHRDGLALYRLMYNNAGTDFVCLARKKVIFDRAMRTLYGL
jgi:intein-encoded DNA endonuclease-like protein